MSLKIKITFLVILLIVAIMASVTYVFTVRELKSRREEVTVRMERIARNIASIRSLETVDWEVYQGYIDELLAFNKDIVYIAIFDEKGGLKAHALNVDWVDVETDRDLDWSQQAQIVWQLDQGMVAEESKRDFEAVPVNIKRGEQNLGTVKVGFSLIDINDQIRDNLYRNLQLAGIFLLLGILASIFLSQKVVKPLERLTRAMLNISRGDLDQRLNIQSRDEIGEMAQTFNFMTEGLKQKELIEGFARELGFTFELNRVIKLMVERICQALNSQQGFLFLKDRIQLTTRLKGKYAYPEREFKEKRMELGCTVVDFFLSQRKPISNQNIPKENEWIKFISEMQPEIGETEAALIAPIISKDELLGLLVLAPKRDGDRYSQEEERFLATLVGQGAMAIENAILYEELTEQERLKRELEIARQVQLKLLPQENPQIPGWDVNGICLPAMEVGGDYYDYLYLDDDKLGIVIADVTGKGTSAAFYMAELKGMMLSLAGIYSSPRTLLSELNKRLYRNVDRRVFASMIYGIIYLEKREICFARAGHNPLLLKRKERTKCEFLTPGGIGLGLEKGEIFDQTIVETRIKLNSGDTLIFYTDGITEAMDTYKKEDFGEERLMDILEANDRLNSTGLREKIIQEVEAFTKGAPHHDDMTLVVVKA